MNGNVNDVLEAVLPVMLLDQAGQAFEVDAVIDTGSTAWLTLPKEVIEELQLPQVDLEQATLADGQTISCNSYRGEILWAGRLRTIQIVELNMVPLIGMKLLEGCRLSIDVRANGDVHVSGNDEPDNIVKT